MLLADHGLFHLEADLRWIDMTAARCRVAQEVARETANVPMVMLVGGALSKHATSFSPSARRPRFGGQACR